MNPTMLKPSGNDFKSVSDFNAKWADRIALLILVGLLVDIGDVFVSANSIWKSVATIIADVLIMAGVWGELWFLKRARTADDSRVAQAENSLTEALNRAARAEEQLAPRMLTEEQCAKLQMLEGKISAVNITSPSGNDEANMFARQIATVLSNAGITARICSPRIGLTWTDIYIVLPTRPMDFRTDPLFATFKSAAFSVGAGDRSQTPLGDLSSDVPVIMVGEKRGFPYPDPTTWPQAIHAKPANAAPIRE